MSLFQLSALVSLVAVASSHPSKVAPKFKFSKSSNTPGSSNMRLIQAFQNEGLSNLSTPEDEFSCPTGYSYLTYTDLTNNKRLICKAMNARGIDRLQAGGSVGGPLYKCRDKPYDGRTLGGAACVQTEIVDWKVEDGNSCPTGYDIASDNEALESKEDYCGGLGVWDVARVGAKGVIGGSGYNCLVQDYDTQEVGKVLCVKRNILDTKIVRDYNEQRCGEGNSLVSVAEVLGDHDAYCNVLGPWDIVRLQGGASLQGSAYKCKVKLEDQRQLGNSLCSPMEDSRVAAKNPDTAIDVSNLKQ